MDNSAPTTEEVVTTMVISKTTLVGTMMIMRNRHPHPGVQLMIIINKPSTPSDIPHGARVFGTDAVAANSKTTQQRQMEPFQL